MNHETVTVAQLYEFDQILDVRSPAEFAVDHVPGALNCPVLDDEERARVGTLYAQESPFTAKKLGAALVARNIARHVEEKFVNNVKAWRPLVYCWRGGQRSAALVHVLRQIGWDAKRLAGGYKAYRHAVVAELDEMAGRIDFRVICGLTGSGKSTLLRHLSGLGANVLDLEQLAAHRGSLLGDLPGEPQPSQKMFETGLWQALRAMDPGKPVYVESESRMIGRLRVPAVLLERLRASECLWLETELESRVGLLLRDYGHLTQAPALLLDRLERLAPLLGRRRIDDWKAAIEAAQWPGFVADLLQHHYDPAYRKSIGLNYARLAAAQRVFLAGIGDRDFRRVAAGLLAPASVETVPASTSG
jgi:tRNA 2-selenouridine synthase